MYTINSLFRKLLVWLILDMTKREFFLAKFAFLSDSQNADLRTKYLANTCVRLRMISCSIRKFQCDIHTYIHTHLHSYTPTYTYTYTYTPWHTCICVCVHARVLRGDISKPVHGHTHTHMYMHIYDIYDIHLFLCACIKNSAWAR